MAKKKPATEKQTSNGHWRSKIVGHDRVAPDQLVANPLNYRKHPQAQRDALKAAIEEVGFIRSVTVNKRTGNLIDGHERVWQALTSEQPFIDVEYVDLSEEEEKLALATMDPISEMATTDGEILDQLLRDVNTGSEHLQQLLSDMASDAGILDGLTAGEVVEDEVPPPPADPITKPGDLWILGEHRLLCGDSTSAKDVGRLMGVEKWQCMVTDPPYGVDYQGGRNPVSNVPREKLAGDGNANIYAQFLPVWAAHRAKKGVLYLWFADRCGATVFAAVERFGWEVRALIIWNKIDAHYGNFMAQYMQKHEPCLYCVCDGTDWYGPTNEVTVWDVKQPTRNEHHPTEKPVSCMARGMKNSTKVGDLVVDSFSGSGTTIIAAEQLGRKCYAMEISPQYCDVAVQRWEKLTGKEAKREQHG